MSKLSEEEKYQFYNRKIQCDRCGQEGVNKRIIKVHYKSNKCKTLAYEKNNPDLDEKIIKLIFDLTKKKSEEIDDLIHVMTTEQKLILMKNLEFIKSVDTL